jgi:hypothetical protein
MKRIALCIAVVVSFLSFAFGEAQQNPTDKKSEQEVRHMIESYRTALLRRDIPALERILG